MKFPKLESPAILSPMAGVTDVAFRTLAKRFGAGMTYTEFVSSTGFVRGTQQDAIVTDSSEHPIGVQLFGSNITDIIEAGRLLSPRFDVIDINCGCPAWKVIKTGAGSALLNEPAKIKSLVKLLVEAVDRPITVKIRSGIDEKHINAVEVAKAAESAGAAAIAVHGRTQKQGYTGKADWEIISKVKAAVCIPVIGNGDVFTPEDFKARLQESGVDYIMVARGAIGNPHIFQEINDSIMKGSCTPMPRLEQFREYLTLAKEYSLPIAELKSQAMQFTKGIVGGTKLRHAISTSKTLNEIQNILVT